MRQNKKKRLYQLELNDKFSKEYQELDNILRDIYPARTEKEQSNSGIKRYLIVMKENGWENSKRYRKLNNLLIKRNKKVHEDPEINFNEEEIKYIIYVKNKFLDKDECLSSVKKRKNGFEKSIVIIALIIILFALLLIGFLIKQYVI